MKTNLELKGLGKEASQLYITSGVPLNDSIIKIANRENLNQQQIFRASENANVETYLQLVKLANSPEKYITFEVANPQEILKSMEKVATSSPAEDQNLWEDYKGSVKDFSIFMYKTAAAAKDAPEPAPSKFPQILKTARQYEGEIAYAYHNFNEQKYNLADRLEDFFKIAKQITLETSNYTDVDQVIHSASPLLAEELSKFAYARMCKIAPRMDFNKTASTSEINTDSELYKIVKELEFKTAYMTKLAALTIDLNNEYNEYLSKFKLLGFNKVAGVVGSIASSIKAHPILTTVATSSLMLPAAYFVGKKRGEAEQSTLNEYTANQALGLAQQKK